MNRIHRQKELTPKITLRKDKKWPEKVLHTSLTLQIVLSLNDNDCVVSVRHYLLCYLFLAFIYLSLHFIIISWLIFICNHHHHYWSWFPGIVCLSSALKHLLNFVMPFFLLHTWLTSLLCFTSHSWLTVEMFCGALECFTDSGRLTHFWRMEVTDTESFPHSNVHWDFDSRVTLLRCSTWPKGKSNALGHETSLDIRHISHSR